LNSRRVARPRNGVENVIDVWMTRQSFRPEWRAQVPGTLRYAVPEQFSILSNEPVPID
jgi:hypothetical protein